MVSIGCLGLDGELACHDCQRQQQEPIGETPRHHWMAHVACGSLSRGSCRSAEALIQELAIQQGEVVQHWSLEIFTPPKLLWRGELSDFIFRLFNLIVIFFDAPNLHQLSL